MAAIKKKKSFTFLELLIAVIIFLIVTVVITAVYRVVINSYKKGTEYSDLSQTLSGTFLVMKHDLLKLVRINDKDSVHFKKDKFSFIAEVKNQHDKTILQEIQYSIENNKLLRRFTEYPDSNLNTGEPVLFLDNITETTFNYMYKKKKRKKKKNSSDLLNDYKKNDNKKTNISKDDKSDSNIKIPSYITISGRIKEGELEKDFKTALNIPLFDILKISKSTKSDTEKQTPARTTVTSNV
ncbi:MAG: type II secretion system GspH family protein [Victivallales bacterium]|nr:type II secretion system GspH family protein [Victivallales bacterium]MCF7888771.1 type II secretion system GspH family protein [Victivallales bacterium]